MRIRKNKKLTASEIVGSSSIPPETLQAHVCLLNRSPWDLFISSPRQDDSSGVNGSIVDSIEAADSESIKLSSEEKLTNEDGDDDDNDGGRHSRTFRSSNINDGTGWQCGLLSSVNDVYSLCGQNQPSLVPFSATKPAAATTMIAVAPRKRGRPRKYPEVPPPQVSMEPPIVFPGSSTNPINPYELYNYYPGLDQHWGKQIRGDGSNNEGGDGFGKRSWSSDREDISRFSISDDGSMLEDSGELDYIGDANDKEAEGSGGGGGGNVGRRRGRRPVKARSLKSLIDTSEHGQD